MSVEKIKMLKGEEYNPEDKTLKMERDKARQFCFDFNLVPPKEKIRKQAMLKAFLGKVGQKFNINGPFYCDYGYNIFLGENFYANFDLTILDAARVIFGDNVLIGPNCGFYTSEHPLDPISRQSGIETARPIFIGNNVWIGGGVKVVAGVNIGDGCVIGAGSVVAKSIPDYCIAVGSPARVIKEIDKKYYSLDEIDEILTKE